MTRKDLFRRNPPEINADMPLLDRWLTILSEKRTDRILRLLEIFPEYRELYGEIADFMRKPEELMEMHSDILRILDRNSERNMVSDLQSIVEEKEQEIREKEQEIRENRKRIGLRDEQLRKKDEQLRKKDELLKENNRLYQLRLIKQVQKQMRRQKTLHEIADELEVDEQEIASIHDLILKHGVDCKAEKILELLHFG